VKPMNTNDLLVQIEALLVTHEDSKRREKESRLELVAGTPSAAIKKAATRRKAPAAKLARAQ